MQRTRPQNRLRDLRKAQVPEVKPYDLAARFRVDPGTVYRWENGRSPVPDEVKLELAAHYGITVAYLMGWPEQAAAA